MYWRVDLADVIEGRGPAPRQVLALVAALPVESRTVALTRGGLQYVGWDETRALLAGIYDAMNVNTRATGHWKGKPPTIPEWPRPKVKKKKAVTVKDIYAAFNPGR